MNKEDLLIRKLALDIVLAVSRKEELSHNAIGGVLEKYDYLDRNKKAFIKRLSSGTIEKKLRLDYVIDLYSKTKTSKMKPTVLAILEMGAYQILFMDNVYDTKACNETVELAKSKGLTNLSGFINGVLRTIVRQKDNIPYPKQEEDEDTYLSIMYSTPVWLVRLIRDQYGSDVCLKILKSLDENLPVTLRVRPGFEDIVLKWKTANPDMEIRESGILPYVYEVSNVSLGDLQGYDEGAFAVQDISSVLIGELSGAVKGNMCLDVCAAPGGKSCHMADIVGNEGQVIACDISDKKVGMICENAERLGLDNIECKVWDATSFNPEWEEMFDIVICDVPCSGIGVMNKKADIKYRITPKDLESLALLQLQIAENVCRYVKKGGTLLYSTCTINKGENEENVRKFLERHGEFKQEKADGIPKSLEDAYTEGVGLQLIEGVNPTDGFFISKLVKRV